MSARTHVLVVGGGASGLIFAAHLLSHDPDVRVTIVEKRARTGGVAYATDEPSHSVNTRAGNMSAMAAEPDHLWHWLERHGTRSELCPDRFCFVPRKLYGDYLAALVDPWRIGVGDGRLHIVTGECIGLRLAPDGVAASLADGSAIVAHAAVLATGHVEPVRDNDAMESPWRLPPADPDRPVLIVGTGLTMVDCLLALADRGQRAPVMALSRRAALPHVHVRNTPVRLDRADVPLGSGAAYTMRWLRRIVVEVEAKGGDWRDVVDGVRPHGQALWQAASNETRRRFMRHARVAWDCRRHRMPPASHERVAAALGTGALRIVRGAFLGATRTAAGVAVRYRPGGSDGEAMLDVGQVIDARGILRDPHASASPLIRGLLDAGLARIDPLRLGIDVTAECTLVGRDGRAVQRIAAVGPVTRAQFWEITAVPDIRDQAAALARRMAAALATRREPAATAARPLPSLSRPAT